LCIVPVHKAVSKDCKTLLWCSLQNKCFLNMGVIVDVLQQGTAGETEFNLTAGIANFCTEEVWILKES